MKLRRWVGVCLLLAVLLVAAGLLISAVPGLRWRATVARLKATGRLPEVSWIELSRMLRPDGPYYIEDVATLGSGYAGIRNPYRSIEDRSAGLQEFAARCATCHGDDGSGGAAPDLRSATLTRSNTDWAMYKVIQQGLPVKGMPAHPLGDRGLWQLVAAVQALRRQAAAVDAGDSVGWQVEMVSSERLLGAAADSGNWLMYHGAYNGWRHSRLRQLDSSTVRDLRVVWVYQTRDELTRVETTPLVVGGMMYITEPGATVVALDAATGVQRWRFTPRLGEVHLCCGPVNRGVAIADSTVIVGTPDARLIALDARTGRLRWSVQVADSRKGYSFTSAPLVVGSRVIAGIAGGEFGIRGFVDAYEVDTGRRAWRFHTIPAPGEPGSETWGNGNALPNGGGPAWLTGTYDPVLDLVYLGVGNPGPSYDGTDRPGDNLYTNSVIALTVATGKLAWHFQFTPHDTHDYDAVQVPVLVDAVRQGVTRRLLMMATKNAFYYVLDRETGRFVTAKPFATQTWAEGLDSAGRPIARMEAAPSRTGAMVYPSQNGATNWWSPSYSPRSGLFYIPAREQGSVFFLNEEEYEPGQKHVGGLSQPGDAERWLRAVDALTGEIRWEQRFKDWDPTTLLGGVLSTAGGLVFGGSGNTFTAFHDRTGEVLWSFNVGGRVASAAITWLHQGRQRVTIAAGRAILTFERPESP